MGGYQPLEVRAQPPIRCRREGRTQVLQPPRPQLVLGQPGCHHEILRSDLCRPQPHEEPQRSSHQLDRQPRTQAPRNARTHQCRTQGTWTAKEEGTPWKRNQGRIMEGRLAPTQPDEAQAIPLEALRLVAPTLYNRFLGFLSRF